MKQKNSNTIYPEALDTGTYQTGNTTPPKKGNLLVTVLLMLVIFLGGIASALGIINLRLLAQLQAQQPTETVPVKVQQGNQNPMHDTTHLATTPSIPQINFSMHLADPDVGSDSNDNANIPQTANPSIVGVTSGSNENGSGLVLTEDGYILTFAHLVDRSERILVTLPDGTVHRAALVGTDMFSDLAVLYIRASRLTAAVFVGASSPAPGCKVTAMCGSDFVSGTVFSVEQALKIGNHTLPLLRTSAATGEKAGFLWNSNGQVMGIISPRISKYLCCEESDLAYVLPGAAVKTVVDQLLHRGFVAGCPSIGANVEEVTDLYQNYWKLPDGLRITDVSNTALRNGDILVSINGISVTTYSQLYEILYTCRVGQEVQAVVYRGGQKIQLSFPLNEANS